MTNLRSNQSMLREINPEYSLEGLVLKLKFQCLGHLMRTDDSLEKSLIMEKIESTRGHQRMRWLIASLMQQTWTWTNSGRWWRTGRPGLCSPWSRKEVDLTGQLNNNSTVTRSLCKYPLHWTSSIAAIDRDFCLFCLLLFLVFVGSE